MPGRLRHRFGRETFEELVRAVARRADRREVRNQEGGSRQRE
jgi:hypothetical protein